MRDAHRRLQWNNLTNASSQEASSRSHDKAWLPADKAVREKFWSTAWTPVLSVTPEAIHQNESTAATTASPAAHESSVAAAVPSPDATHALLSLSESGSPPSSPPAHQSGSKSDSLEWQPSVASDRRDEHHAEIQDDFNAFAARNTRTYVPVGQKIGSDGERSANHKHDSLTHANAVSKSGSLRTQKVSWDDHIEFPSSTQRPQKTAIESEVRATTTSIWADQQTSPVDSITSSTNSKKWSSRSQRISNRFGTIREVKPESDGVRSEEFGQRQKLQKTYEDAVADIESSAENQGTGGESESLSLAGKTNSNNKNNKERLAVKGRQAKKTRQQQQPQRQKVALQINISPAVDDSSHQQSNSWSNAKVSQYFRWTDASTSAERLLDDDEDSTEDPRPRVTSSSLRFSDKSPTTTSGTLRPTQRSTVRPVVNRSGSLKGTTRAFARQRQPATTTLAPDYETEEEEDVTERTITTRGPQLQSAYEKAARQATVTRQTPTTRKSSQRIRVTVGTKSQSVVQSSGKGYEWKTDIDHNNERPAEIRLTTFRGDEEEEQPPSTRYTKPTTKSVVTTVSSISTTARPTVGRLQTKTGRQTGQRQVAVKVLKASFENEAPVSAEAEDEEDASLEDKARFQKKSGVQYTSVEREEEFSRETDFQKKSGEQANNPDDPENCRLEDSIPGTPLTDYPTYSEIPKTNFKCSDHTLPGYYGDVEAQCQV